MSETTPAQLLPHVKEQVSYVIRCSDCECYGDEYFWAEQAAELSAKAGWRLLGTRVVCDRCGSRYPLDSPAS